MASTAIHKHVEMERPPSEELVDMHVYIVPSEYWSDEYNCAYNQVMNFTVSAGFIRVIPHLRMDELRPHINDQIGDCNILPKEYLFLKSVGRSLAQITPKQERHMKVKNFLPPFSYSPELFLLDKYRENVPKAVLPPLSDNNFPNGGPQGVVPHSNKHNNKNNNNNNKHNNKPYFNPEQTSGNITFRESQGMSPSSERELNFYSPPELNVGSPTERRDPEQIPITHAISRGPSRKSHRIDDHYEQPLSATPPQTPEDVIDSNYTKRRVKREKAPSTREEAYTNETNEDSGIASEQTPEQPPEPDDSAARAKREEEQRKQQQELDDKEREIDKMREEEERRLEAKEYDLRRQVEQDEWKRDQELEKSKMEKERKLREKEMEIDKMLMEKERELDKKLMDKERELQIEQEKREREFEKQEWDMQVEKEKKERELEREKMKMEEEDRRRQAEKDRFEEEKERWEKDFNDQKEREEKRMKDNQERFEKESKDKEERLERERKERERERQQHEESLKKAEDEMDLKKKSEKLNEVAPKEPPVDEDDQGNPPSRPQSSPARIKVPRAATPQLRLEFDKLLAELKRTKEERLEVEHIREDLIRKAKALQLRAQNKRQQARDAWKKKYFEEKKKTMPLEEQCNKLRKEMDSLHRKLVVRLEKDKENQSSNAQAYLIQNKIHVTKLQHDLDDLKQRVDDSKMKLMAEMKLRNQAETELRALRAELTQKKINAAMNRSQQMQAMKDAEHFNTPR